jgi:murein DD-endopeptidase MepM/ murein hydrolase activator NlpD
MNRAAALPAALSLSVLLACTGREAAAPETVTEDMATAADAASAATPAPTPAPTASQAVQTGFTFTGELTQGGYIRGVAPSSAVSAVLGEQPLELAEDGSFFAAFDRDSGPALTLKATLANGRTLEETLTIAPRAWDIERVNVAKGTGGGSEAWWAKREPEWLAIKAAREMETGATGWSQDFIWPVKGRISGRFGRQRIYRGEPGSYHSGLDIAPGAGVAYVAPADGVVVLARTGFSLEGGLIIIDHGAGLNSAFLHSSRIVVTEGQHVKQGEHIGNVGATGRASGPHLHWSLKWNDARLDPLLFVGPQN